MMMAAAMQAADEANRPPQITKVVRADPRTGKLVRSVVATSRAAPTPKTASAAAVAATVPPPTSISQAIDLIATSQSLQPSLVHSVIKVESNYNPLAVSPKGAQGLMQLMPDTARRFGVSNSFDPIDNIQGGARYLKYLLDLYKGDYRLTLAAYNAGEGAVQKYGDVPPFSETQNYLIQVDQQLKNLAPPPHAVKPVEPAPTVEKPAGPAPIHRVVGPDGTILYTSR